jgi:type I site-specific restriction endonuclease
MSDVIYEYTLDQAIADGVLVKLLRTDGRSCQAESRL